MSTRCASGRFLLFTIGAASALLAVLTACGGPAKPVKPPSAADGGAAPSARSKASPPPSGLPPLAPMPAPGVIGSRKAKLKRDPAQATCAAGAEPATSKVLADQVKRVGEACAAATKMHPVGQPLRGQQNDRDAHQEQKVRVEANKCYRIYFAADDEIKDAVLVVRDSAGDMVAESPGSALPESGAMCFTAADEVTLLVGIGAGKGSWAAQVWSD